MLEEEVARDRTAGSTAAAAVASRGVRQEARRAVVAAAAEGTAHFDEAHAASQAVLVVPAAD